MGKPDSQNITGADLAYPLSTLWSPGKKVNFEMDCFASKISWI